MPESLLKRAAGVRTAGVDCTFKQHNTAPSNNTAEHIPSPLHGHPAWEQPSPKAFPWQQVAHLDCARAPCVLHLHASARGHAGVVVRAADARLLLQGLQLRVYHAFFLTYGVHRPVRTPTVQSGRTLRHILSTPAVIMQAATLPPSSQTSCCTHSRLVAECHAVPATIFQQQGTKQDRICRGPCMLPRGTAAAKLQSLQSLGFPPPAGRSPPAAPRRATACTQCLKHQRAAAYA